MDSSGISEQNFEAKHIGKRGMIFAALLIIAALGLAVGAAHAAKRIQLNSSASFPVDI